MKGPRQTVRVSMKIIYELKMKATSKEQAESTVRLMLDEGLDLDDLFDLIEVDNSNYVVE